MKFQVRVRHVGDKDSGWWEPYDKPIEDAHKWVRETLASFNNTLRPGEKAREVLEVKIDDPAMNTGGEHVWRKVNLITISDRHGLHDIMKCELCGVTGKRFGVGGVKRDSKFRARKFERCDRKIVDYAQTVSDERVAERHAKKAF